MLDILIRKFLTACLNKLPSPKTPGTTPIIKPSNSNKLTRSLASPNLQKLGKTEIEHGKRTLYLRPSPEPANKRPSFSRKIVRQT